MTLSTTSTKAQFNGNGATTAFPFSFKFTAAGEIEVILTSAAGVDTLKTLTTHYTLSAPGDSGTVTMLVAPASGETLTVRRIMPMTQALDLAAGGNFTAAAIEAAFDKLSMISQQLLEKIRRAAKFRDGSTTGEVTLPQPAAGKVLAWNSGGTDLENVAVADIGSATFPASATDNAVPRFNGASGTSLQSSGVIIDDSNDVSGVVNFTQAGYHDITEISAPSSPAANVSRIYAVDASTATTLAAKDNAGNVVPLSHFTQAGTGAVVRTQHAKLMESLSVLDFIPASLHADILARTSATDVSSYIQAAITRAVTAGAAVHIPAGRYRLTSGVTIDEDPLTTEDEGTRVVIYGDGCGNTQLDWRGTGFCITYTGDDSGDGIIAEFRLEGFAVDGTGAGGQHGIDVNDAALFSMEDMKLFELDVALRGLDTLSWQIATSYIRWNKSGVELSFNDAFSRPNSITFLDCVIGNNGGAGLTVTDGSAVRIIGGSVEGNGHDSGASTRCGVKISDAGLEGCVGLIADGVYFELNGPNNDIWIDQSSATRCAHIIQNCTFQRHTGTDSPIRMDCSSGTDLQVNVIGCGFKGFGGYTPSSGTLYVDTANCAGSDWRLNLIANHMESSTERPALSANVNYIVGEGIGICAAESIQTFDTFRAQGVNPGFWLDETGGGNKGAYVVLDGGTLQVQRRAQSFGAAEATVASINISAPDNSLNISSAGALRTAGDGIGYMAGAGGTVTQATSKSTGVTLNECCGEITMNGAQLNADTTVSFTLTNSKAAAGDVIILNHVTTGAFGSYTLNGRCAAGSVGIDVRNITPATNLSEAIVIRFAIIKAVTT